MSLVLKNDSLIYGPLSEYDLISKTRIALFVICFDIAFSDGLIYCVLADLYMLVFLYTSFRH